MCTSFGEECNFSFHAQGLMQKIGAGGANKIRGHITRACWAAQLAFEWNIRDLLGVLPQKIFENLPPKWGIWGHS